VDRPASVLLAQSENVGGRTEDGRDSSPFSLPSAVISASLGCWRMIKLTSELSGSRLVADLTVIESDR
jgi:hypothetical protein